MALGLNLNWATGFLVSNKVKKELLRVQYNNLNGQTGFEFLMVFCQMQIMLLVFIYLCLLFVVRSLLVELKEMDVLAQKDNGQIWAAQYDQMPLQSVQAILISFGVIQMLMMASILAYLFRFAQAGIQWSNKQEKSRSRGYFLVISCVVLPLYDSYLAYSTREMRQYVKDVPEIEWNFMPTWLMWIIYGLIFQTAILAIVGFFAVVCQSKFMTQNFIYVKIAQFVLLLGVFFVMVVNNVRVFGFADFESNWPRILKFVDMREFDSGLMACEGGKYLQTTQISSVLTEVECPIWSGYEGLTKRDFTALLWEFKGSDIVATDDAIYGCLNVECGRSLKSGLLVNQFIIMFAILGLAFLNMFSIGLASHTMKFDIHYRNVLANVFIFVSLLGIITGGVLVTLMTQFSSMRVNPDSNWSEQKKFALPALSAPTLYNEEEWYRLTTSFKLVENCDLVVNKEENCNALYYKLSVRATSGSLRVNAKPQNAPEKAAKQVVQSDPSNLNFTGSVEEINSLLAGTEFSPVCDDASPGQITLIFSASATGPMAKTQTYAQLLPEG